MNYEEMNKKNIELRNILLGKSDKKPTGYPSKDKPHLTDYPEKAFKEPFPKMSIYEYVYENNKNHLDDIALVFDTGFSETPITYRQFFKNVDVVAKGLTSRGVKKGDKVAICLPNIPETAYIIYGVNKIGAVACLLDPRINEYGLERDLKDLDAKTYIGISETYKTVKKVNKNINLDNILIIPTIQSSNKKMIKKLYTFSKIKEGNGVYDVNRKWSKFISKKYDMNEVTAPIYNDQDVAIITYTGGTTGVHKGVKISNDGLNTLVFAHKYLYSELGRGDVFANILPQFMIFGLFPLHLALRNGFETHLILDPSPEKFVDYLVKLNPALVLGGPVHWETLIDNPKITKGCLSNLKDPVTGGERISIEQEQRITDVLKYAGAQSPLCNGFGSSELGGSVTVNKGKDWEAGTVGKLHIFDNAKIIDPETNEELKYNEIGELYVSSPDMMVGYYNNPKEEKKAISIDEDGVRWFRTGDLASMNEKGNITIHGRMKRLFVCGVDKVYPPQMEELIDGIDNVKKCAIVNLPDKELREVPKAHIVLEKDTEENRKAAIDSIVLEVTEKISENVVPKYFEFHDELMYTSNGKIDFEGLRKKDLKTMNLDAQKTKTKK